MMEGAHDLQPRSGGGGAVLECWGTAHQALKAYRQRIRELEQEGRAKPDMIAFKELRARWTPERQHGEIPGVPIGLQLRGRGEAAILGIHQMILRGIDAIKEESCYAVCISGGYADDDDLSSTDGSIYYTGEGGQNKRREQQEDQTDERVGNQALLRSIETGLSIRVLRGRHPRYHYLGLYRCTEYTYEPGIHGKNIFTFTLVPVIENQNPGLRSLPLDSKFHSAAAGGRRSTVATTNASLLIRAVTAHVPLADISMTQKKKSPIHRRASVTLKTKVRDRLGAKLRRHKC